MLLAPHSAILFNLLSIIFQPFRCANSRYIHHPRRFAVMAVLSKVPGLEVRIVVRDESLCEYEERCESVPENTLERYVEAHTNAHFELHVVFNAPFPSDRAVAMLVSIDGEDVDQPMIHPHELFDRKGHTSSGQVYKSGSRWKVRKYRFQGIRIGD
jgi:hypothetical protein